MEASLKETLSTEESAVKGYGELKAAKTAEAAASKKAITTKSKRAADLAVSIVQNQDGLEDTTLELADTQKFLATLDSQCVEKKKEWALREKLRAEEIQAISEAISIMNDDDALDVFKKALPSAMLQEQVRFLQAGTGAASRARKAQAIIAGLVKTSSHSKMMRLMLFSLNANLKLQAKQHARGRGDGFGKVMEMVDDMVTLEGKEQQDDDKQMPWCNGEFEKSDRDEKSEKKEIEALEAQSAADADSIAQLNEEHEDYVEMMQMSGVAVELVGKAKNRLNKFYNPVLYKAEPVKKEMSMEEKIIEAGSFAQLNLVRADTGVAPPPPPETFGAYEKSGEKATGVLGLMDTIVRELENDMKDAEYEEKTAQKDYEELMTDSAETREARS